MCRSSPNPVVAIVFGSTDDVQRSPRVSCHEIPVFELWGRHTRFVCAGIQRVPLRLLVLAFSSRIWSPALDCATASRVRQRITVERESELHLLDWLVGLCELEETSGNLFLVENPVGATNSSQRSSRRLRGACSVWLGASHTCVCCHASTTLEACQVCDKQSRTVEIRGSKVSGLALSTQ